MSYLPFISTLAAMFALIYYLYFLTNKYSSNINLTSYESYIAKIDELENYINIISEKHDQYIDGRIAENIKSTLYKLIEDIEKYNINTQFYKYDIYLKGKDIILNFNRHIKKLNKKFVDVEVEICNSFFSNIDGKSLDLQQRKAIVTDELHNLIVAGAGSGKTLTISGKVKYLYERKHISPEQILLITFTEKAANEMQERINNKLNIPVKAMTFHKLGINICTDVLNERLNIFDDIEGFIKKELRKQAENNDAFMSKLLTFFAYYISLIEDPMKYDTYGDYISYLKTCELESLKSKYIKAIKRNDLLSISGEKVHSVQEVIIANFFFLNGIRYEYEKTYPYRSDTKRKAYKPDFYLPDYDVYWEHFSVDENMKCHLNSNSSDNKKYEEDMQWKRAWHKQNGTTLIESYAYYGTDANLINKLYNICEKNDIKIAPINKRKLFDQVFLRSKERMFTDFSKLMASFLTLFKTRGYDADYFDKFVKKSKITESEFMTERTQLFMSLAHSLYTSYEIYLKDNHMIDFSDMINDSTHYIQTNKKILNYKYIIIDEYQDIGFDRYRLVKSILEQCDAKLMCVGDDWQSIYRFAGSDVCLFTEFKKYWGKSEILKIEKTYRNSQQLIDIAGNFVMKNTQQFKKKLKSDKSCMDPINAYYTGNEDIIDEVLEKIIKDIVKNEGETSSILLLGRTRYDLDIVVGNEKKKSQLFKKRGEDKIIYTKLPKLNIKFLTVHKAKGTEADNVILLNARDDILGFPNKISDDPILKYVLSDESSYPYAEERRLFYVALTRTKNRIYIVLNPHRESVFYYEIENSVSGSRLNNENTIICPKCNRGDLVIRINRASGEKFYGCSNYPFCDYTMRMESFMLTDVSADETTLNIDNEDYASTEKTLYKYCSVLFDGSFKIYHYIDDKLNVKIGDRVAVNVKNEEKYVTITGISYYNDDNAPFPPNKTKRIIRIIKSKKDIDIICDNLLKKKNDSHLIQEKDLIHTSNDQYLH